MDQDLYRWSPLVDRPPISWPGGAPLALAVIMLLEHVEVVPPAGSFSCPMPAGSGPFPFPDLPTLGPIEYGYRVGAYRIVDSLAEIGIHPAAAIDAMLAERIPELVSYCQANGVELIGHGISASRLVSSNMGEGDEREYIRESIARLEAASGVRPVGWMSPAQCESTRTPKLLDEAGIEYVCDWPNDEQPYFMNTPDGLVSLPTSYELDDSYLVWDRKATPAEYSDTVLAAIRRLVVDGAHASRCAVIVIRPWLVGQPFRIRSLTSVLESFERDQVWVASPIEIVRAFKKAQDGKARSRDD